MVARIRGIGAKKLSYAGRITLINSVLNTLYNYWATMFIIPKGVIKRIEAICRNYLWDGSADYHRVPMVAWDTVTLPKNEGGLGIIKAELWNIATVGKLVDWVYCKADRLWIRWINQVYLLNQEWHGYLPPASATWSWKNVCKVKELLKGGYDNDAWANCPQGYTIRSGYDWLRTARPVQNWPCIVWNKWNIPKHSIITWMMMNGGMNLKEKLLKLGCCDDDLCCVCNQATETYEHLFISCEYGCRIRGAVERWIGRVLPDVNGLISGRKESARWKLCAAILNAILYNIWRQRNNARIHGMLMRPEVVAKLLQRDVKSRIQAQLRNVTQSESDWLNAIGM